MVYCDFKFVSLGAEEVFLCFIVVHLRGELTLR